MADFKVLSDLKPTTNDGKSFKPAILAAFQEFQKKFMDMFADLRKEFEELCQEQDQKICALTSEVSQLKKHVSKLEEKIDDQEAYERRDTLILSGNAVPVHSVGENCANVAKEIIQKEFQLVVSSNDISVSHRLGRKPTNQRPDKRNIIIKFCRRDTKSDVLAASRRVKSPNLYANESLTPTRQSISYALRKAKREFPEIINGTSTSDGKVYAFLKSSNPAARDTRILINSYESLDKFCVSTLNQPMVRFLPPRPIQN